MEAAGGAGENDMVRLMQPPAADDGRQLVLDLEGYEGPLDMLLDLARSQKVDLRHISILALAEQYLVFVSEARRVRLELAADYLVMAAWLAYLKSRLLLPDVADGDEPSGEELAARLAFQLRRLEAMREVAAQLMSGYRLGRDVFARGAPEGVVVTRHSLFDASLFELLQGYAGLRARADVGLMQIERPPVYPIEEALARLRSLIGKTADWTRLEAFFPPATAAAGSPRSVIASTFAATLEATRVGDMEIRQLSTFGTIFLRRGKTPETG